MMSKSYNKLNDYAFGLVAMRRYTVARMREKLDNYAKKFGDDWEESAAEVQNNIGLLLQRLADLKYLDDEKFVEDYVSEKMRFSPRGRYRISQELRQKGVKKEIIDNYFSENDLEKEEVSAARKCLDKKHKKWGELSEFERKNKAFAYLGSRGFGMDIIYKALDTCYNPTEE